MSNVYYMMITLEISETHLDHKPNDNKSYIIFSIFYITFLFNDKTVSLNINIIWHHNPKDLNLKHGCCGSL